MNVVLATFETEAQALDELVFPVARGIRFIHDKRTAPAIVKPRNTTKGAGQSDGA